MGCKRKGETIPYKFNQGLGLFDKYRRRLPDYAIGFGGKVTVKRRGPFIPFLSVSIYLMRERDETISYPLGGRTTHEHATEI